MISFFQACGTLTVRNSTYVFWDVHTRNAAPEGALPVLLTLILSKQPPDDVPHAPVLLTLFLSKQPPDDVLPAPAKSLTHEERPDIRQSQ